LKDILLLQMRFDSEQRGALYYETLESLPGETEAGGEGSRRLAKQGCFAPENAG